MKPRNFNFKLFNDPYLYHVLVSSTASVQGQSSKHKTRKTSRTHIRENCYPRKFPAIQYFIAHDPHSSSAYPTYDHQRHLANSLTILLQLKCVCVCVLSIINNAPVLQTNGFELAFQKFPNSTITLRIVGGVIYDTDDWNTSRQLLPLSRTTTLQTLVGNEKECTLE